MVSPTRRRFLTTTAAGLLGLAATGCSINTRRRPIPRARKQGPLDIAVIGVGGRGAANLAGVADQNIVALCDVDRNHLQAAAQRHPDAALYGSFESMLDEVPLDAVVVSTPDHTHFPAAFAALGKQLDVYCEKPLTRTVHEARVLAEEASFQHAVTQMGIQIHAGGNYRRVVELIRSGAIGRVHEAHCWVGKHWGGGERPTDTPPVPETLDWPRWLGAAPPRPYHPVYHPAGWRRFWDFGTGTLGDMGCHHLDLPFWALGLGLPESVAVEGPPVHAETAPTSMRARWDFPGRVVPSGPVDSVLANPVTLWWHDGGLRPPQFERDELPDWGDGTLFVGE